MISFTRILRIMVATAIGLMLAGYFGDMISISTAGEILLVSIPWIILAVYGKESMREKGLMLAGVSVIIYLTTVVLDIVTP